MSKMMVKNDSLKYFNLFSREPSDNLSTGSAYRLSQTSMLGIP